MKKDKEKSRLQILRECLGFNQTKFAEILKVSNATVSRIEKNERPLTERLANQISKEFGVNEDWLLNGEGEMFRFTSEDEKITEIMSSIITNNDEFMKKVILTFSQLDNSQREFLKNLMKQLT
ncbi:Helix-turn-helix domain protein [[Clostridium] sordellii]|uniref:helix-turn-helix domain-containing protein n=1 Tax=Paraclostridium sordellii TaxID=1505 RepID=UPI00030CA856|nr:helix-turn-helix transcriptional regulator [Paeniclostridium sordellii]TAN63969.1 XRE family transcriptional regulator [Paeniclostridium sordellii 8483]CEK35725.1 Helix-turn-helix domain protein,Predicted transcriptional regulator,addiction module antidote protein, HigA family,Helix-turn-helix domain [[Clostridium] sordellii] [Paeniclostridium sordellii]CEQ10654.1 Helix-turn-helix domain protein [[Clostridium] sordellii] [Paeniclostridium sordellii]